ncbi:MAG: NAD(P)H-hydrate epimerase [Acidimicrobiales bacterium]
MRGAHRHPLGDGGHRRRGPRPVEELIEARRRRGRSGGARPARWRVRQASRGPRRQGEQRCRWPCGGQAARLAWCPVPGDRRRVGAIGAARRRPGHRCRLRHRVRGTYEAPALAGSSPPVLAVDIPSGVDGTTGVASGRPLSAERTVTFAAWKPGLLLADGARLAGRVRVADIGLDVSRAAAHRVTDDDVRAWLPSRPRDAHKWRSAVWVIAGSEG